MLQSVTIDNHDDPKTETQIKLGKERTTRTKEIKTYEMILLRETLFKQDIEKMFPGLQFDLNQKDNKAIFVGQTDIVQSAILHMCKKLQSFASMNLQMSKEAKDLLGVKENTDYILQKMKSQKVIGVWDVVHADEICMFGTDMKEVQKAVQLVRQCLIEKEIPLDDDMAYIVQEDQWSQLVQRIQRKHSRKVVIETRKRSVLIVAVDDVFQDVYDEIKVYLQNHVEELFFTLDPMKLKFLQKYKTENMKALEMKFRRSHVQLSVSDFNYEKGIKIIGTKDVLSEVKDEVTRIANTVITKEYQMVSKEGLKEFIHGYQWNTFLSSVENKFKCLVVMKDSSTSSSWQEEGASGSSKSKRNADQNNEAMYRQHSAGNSGDGIDVCGIKVSIVQGELAIQKVDVIVNSASQTFDLSIGAVSKSILKYGGDSIQRECRQQYLAGHKLGQIIVTSGGNLNCRKIYHGSLGAYNIHGSSIELMKTFVMNCLTLANTNGFQSMAFPALGTGNLGFPPTEVGILMLECIKNFGRKAVNTTLKNIYLVVYPSDHSIVKAFTSELAGATGPSATIQSASSSSTTSTVSGTFKCTLPNFVDLEIDQGDITKEPTYAIVNSVLAISDLSLGEVSKAILRAGGKSIQEECINKRLEFTNHGYIFTSSGTLPCRKIIHMNAQNEAHNWKIMIGKVLCRAEQLNCFSISFPALGTGGKGLSPEEIAKMMYSAFIEFAKSQPVWLKKIRVVLFQGTMLTRFVQAVTANSYGHSVARGSSTPGKHSTSKSKQISLVFSITADSELNLQKAIKELEEFAHSHSF